jgi:ABC-type sulfate transport system permease component
VLVALIFIGLPFVVRTVQPVLEDLDTELEEAAASLGAPLADLPPRDAAHPAARRC